MKKNHHNDFAPQPVIIFQCTENFKLLACDTAPASKGRRISKPVYLERILYRTVLLLEAEEEKQDT